MSRRNCQDDGRGGHRCRRAPWRRLILLTAAAVGVVFVSLHTASVTQIRAAAPRDGEGRIAQASPAPGPVRQATHTAPAVGGAPRVHSDPQAGRIKIGASNADGAKSENSASGSGKPLSTALGSLVAVLGLFIAAAWVVRRAMPKNSQRLPHEVVEVLGYVPLAPRQQARLVRLGNKLLLVGITASGAETLGEVSDAAEVERLLALCPSNTSKPVGNAARGSRASAARGHAAALRDLVQQVRGRPAEAQAPSFAVEMERHGGRGGSDA